LALATLIKISFENSFVHCIYKLDIMKKNDAPNKLLFKSL
jgi:hypothetical protein